MGHSTGRMSEIRIASRERTEMRISCPEYSVPAAGQYLLACALDDPYAVLGTPLYLVDRCEKGFWAASLVPCSWQPGTNLDLVGPLGQGFALPGFVQRLALAALGDSVARLLPLVNLAAQTKTAVTLFSLPPLPKLPAAVEVYPLSSLKGFLDWPDFMALDVPLEALDKIRQILALPDNTRLPCPAQVLVTTTMPCAGVGQCGVCALRVRRGWKLTCQDGPVFDLDKLEW
jgi:hypothetical protein